jgi:hypothetical protein
MPRIAPPDAADLGMADDFDADNSMDTGESPIGAHGACDGGGSCPDDTDMDAYAYADADANAPLADNALLAKTKRIACTICRRRKLRCNGARPNCSTCARLGHKCLYDEVRRKSGPKRGYVKALEERLKQVETMLRTREGGGGGGGGGEDASPDGGTAPRGAQKQQHQQHHQQQHPQPPHQQQQQPPPSPPAGAAAAAFGIPGAAGDKDMDRWLFSAKSPQAGAPGGVDELNFAAAPGLQLGGMGDGNLSWEMIGLGLKEPLPPQEVIDKLCVASPAPMLRWEPPWTRL